ncbi:MAG: S41 family peptidase [Deltaproteobacteria bacterium]|nr:S41 family peptidase [Deltaproteobacteria bacterium]MBI3386323.1 S41 family peptidase [Deltaproteobacteria bacterium]
MTVKRRLGVVATVIVVTAALLLGGRMVSRVSAVAKDAYENIEAFTNVLALVQKNYVDEVTTKQLIDGAITGMLSALDPHSAYLPPEQYKELQVDTRGSFGGLGIEITVKNGLLTVVSPIEDTPAFRAGVKPGDQIIKIEDDFTKDMTLVDAVKRMRGPKGTKIHLTLRREGAAELIDLTLEREVIKIQSVKFHMLEKGYGYIRLTQFQEHSDEDLEKALKSLEKESGGHLSGLVLDLRNNPGGLLTQAVRVSDTFLDSGLVVYTDGRLESQKQKYFAHRQGSHTEFPMIVLVNGGTASASEIVAGALQDHKRALVLGEQTFGKGSVQTILPIDDNAALRLTTARYFTPNGRSIQAMGITPDVVMESVVTAKAEAEHNVPSLREENLPRHLESPSGGTKIKEEKPHDGAPPQGGDGNIPSSSGPPLDPEAAKDPQLHRALELLKSWNVFKTVVAQSQP